MTGNAKTGLLSALGALLGGTAGAMVGHYATRHRSNVRYFQARSRGREAVVVGGAAGAVVGAFVGGALAGGDKPPELKA